MPAARRPPRALSAALRPLDALARRAAMAEARLKVDLALAQLRLRPDDVFLVGFPRSGLSLLQMALYQLTTDGEIRFDHVAAVSPTLEGELLRAGLPSLDRLPSPRVFKSHLLYPRLPRGGRVVYLARNVFDVAVSAHRYAALLAGQEIARDEFLRQFVAGHPYFAGVSWFDHLRSWWPHRDDPGVLFLDYDEAVADLPGTLRQLADFCGLPLDSAHLPRMVERSRLGFMLRYEERFDPRLRRVSGPAGSFIRKGETGGGKAALSPRHRERIAREVAALARRLGCRPGDPYAKLFALDEP